MNYTNPCSTCPQLLFKVKRRKSYALERAILKGLNTLMHKKDFILNICRIEEDVMDVDLYDANLP